MRRDLGWALAFGLLAPACRNDMHDQPRYEPLEASTFFANGMGSRPPVEGTVAVGELREDPRLYLGRAAPDGELVRDLPLPVDAALLQRGRERYDIYCSPCHDRTGSGRGIVVQRGLQQPPALYNEALADKPVGYTFEVITNGVGVMFPYRASVPVRDRWAIVAYVEALQRAHRARLEDLPPEARAELERQPQEAAP